MRVLGAAQNTSALPDAKGIGKFVFVVRPQFEFVVNQNLSTSGDDFPQRLDASAGFDPRHQIINQLLPNLCWHDTVDSLVGEDHRLVFEEGEEDQDPGSVAGLKDLFLEECRLGPETYITIEMIIRYQQASNKI